MTWLTPRRARHVSLRFVRSWPRKTTHGISLYMEVDVVRHVSSPTGRRLCVMFVERFLDAASGQPNTSPAAEEEGTPLSVCLCRNLESCAPDGARHAKSLPPQEASRSTADLAAAGGAVGDRQ